MVNRKTKKTLGKGWHAVDGIWYYFEAGGYIFDEYHGGYAIGGPESGWYQIDDEAPPTYHWEKVTGGWKYVKDTYHEYWDPYLHDESARIDGKIYWFDKNGVTYKPGWQKIGGKYYYLDPYNGGVMAFSYYAEEEQPEYCYVDGYFINDKGVRCQNGYGWHSDANGFWFGKGSYYEKDCMTYINGGWAEFDEYGYCMRYYDVRTDTLWDFTEAVG